MVFLMCFDVQVSHGLPGDLLPSCVLMLFCILCLQLLSSSMVQEMPLAWRGGFVGNPKTLREKVVALVLPLVVLRPILEHMGTG